MDRTDIIDLYLKGLLQGEELDKFLLEMKEDENLAEDIEIKRQIIQALQEVRHEELKNYIARNTKDNVLIRLPGPKWAYGVAASILLLAAAFVLFQDQIPENVNPIAIFQPKEKIEADTSFDESSEVIVDKEPIKEPIVLPLIVEEIEDSNSIVFDDVLMNDFDDKEENVEVRQDKIVRTQTTYTIVHANRMNLIDSSSNIEKTTSAAPNSVKNESDGISEKDKKVKNTEIKAPATAETKDQDLSEFKKEKNQKIQIEFWQSIVSYKGYKWNGKTLRLYGIDSTSSVDLHHLDKNYYLQINKDYFLLKLTDNYESYIKITDAALIERLKK
jgi:hypothetical protein